MKNLSGTENIKNWSRKGGEVVENSTVVIEKKESRPVNKVELEAKLLEVLNEFETEYNEVSDKNLYDAIVSLQGAKRALKNLN